VRELLAARTRKAREVWIAEGTDPSPALREITELATAARVPVRWVGKGQLEHAARTDAPQGVLARAAPLQEVELKSLAKRRPGGPQPFLLVLDGVTDPHNLGALLRTAVSAGATGAVLPRHRAAHVTPTVAKAAAGAIEHLPLAVVSGIPSALGVLSRHGVWSVGLAGDGDQSLFELDLADQPVALVLGAEGKGLGRLTRARCDVVAAIPLFGPLDSLNVAAAGAIASFEFARRRGLRGGLTSPSL
jgi:23S rRNA (guanosine2251-2'-O)-methyltransferase